VSLQHARYIHIIILTTSNSRSYEESVLHSPMCKSHLSFFLSTTLSLTRFPPNRISVVMMSRLMLNLRSPSLLRITTSIDSTAGGPTTDRPCLSTVVDGFPCYTNIDMDKMLSSPISPISEGELATFLFSLLPCFASPRMILINAFCIPSCRYRTHPSIMFSCATKALEPGQLDLY
jgi:hypothetical protein